MSFPKLCIASSFPPTHFLQESSFIIWSKWKHVFQVEEIICTPISEVETQIIRTLAVARGATAREVQVETDQLNKPTASAR